MNLVRAMCVVSAGSISVGAANAGVPSDAIEVLFTAPADVAPGPLVLPPSPLNVSLFAGQPRIASDGTWYALYRFPLVNSSDPLEFTRDFVMLRDGAPFIREGYQLPSDANIVPVAMQTLSQQPFFDVSVAQDGAVAQVIGGTDVFTTRPDGSPDPALFDFEDVKFDVLVLDGASILAEGTPLDIVPGVVAPDNGIERFASVKAADAETLVVSATLSAGGTFDDETRVIFQIDDAGLMTQSQTLRFTDAEGQQVPGHGFEASTFNGSEEDIDANSDGSILIGVDVRGAPFDQDGTIVYYDATTDTYSVVAREGQPSPLPGRNYDSLFNNPLALNDAGDIAFLGSVNGDSLTDGILVVNGQVVMQEATTVGTVVEGPLQLGFANANIEMDAQGNIIYWGAWNKPKADVCPDNTDITSTFAIFEGLFFNDELILEGGVTEVANVDINGTVFPTLVVADLPNTGFAGFHVSPDGRWLIVHALLAEPSPDICAFSVNNNATPLAQVLLRIDLDRVRAVDCPGDADGSGDTTTADITFVVSNLGAGSPGASGTPGDVDGDGLTTTADITFVVSNLGASCG
ncbi:MAG: hypothetical protein AAGD00_00700 [Planctomycetota bacterium]